MLSHFLTYATVALLLALSGVKAGPGANVFACFNTQHSSPPYTFPLDISFNIEEPECMGRKGHHATVTATEPGQICTEIGYVEAKKSGWCFFGASIWELAYATSNGTDGRLITKWESETANVGHGGRGGGTMNVMAFLGGSDDDVSACPTADGCGGATGGGRPRIAWDAGTQGPIYVVFNGQRRG